MLAVTTLVACSPKSDEISPYAAPRVASPGDVEVGSQEAKYNTFSDQNRPTLGDKKLELQVRLVLTNETGDDLADNNGIIKNAFVLDTTGNGADKVARITIYGKNDPNDPTASKGGLVGIFGQSETSFYITVHAWYAVSESTSTKPIVTEKDDGAGNMVALEKTDESNAVGEIAKATFKVDYIIGIAGPSLDWGSWTDL